MGGPLVRFFVVVGAPCSCAATTCRAPREEQPCMPDSSNSALMQQFQAITQSILKG